MDLTKILQAFNVPFEFRDLRPKVTTVLPMLFFGPTLHLQAIVFASQCGSLFLERPMFRLEVRRNPLHRCTAE